LNDTKYDLLDYGYIRLIDSMGSDLSVVRSARVSYDADWRAGEDSGSDQRLINYLVKNHHTSPLESVSFTFEVKAPIFVARQWFRHRTWKFNEVSGRYSILPEEMYCPAPGFIGVQNSDNKQMRDIEEIDSILEQEFRSDIIACNKHCYEVYLRLIDKKCPREIARGVLPLNTYTHFFATVDLHNLLGFLRLRNHAHSQYEIQVYAEQIREMIRHTVPVTLAAFEKHVLGIDHD
jgi:thymidylate synthase (FAD)